MGCGQSHMTQKFLKSLGGDMHSNELRLVIVIAFVTLVNIIYLLMYLSETH